MKNHNLSRLRAITIIGLSLLTPLTRIHNSWSQTFNDVLQSDAFNQVLKDSSKAKQQTKHHSEKSVRPLSNYELLWTSPKPGRLLLEWISAGSTGLRLDQSSSYEREEYIWGFAALRDQQHSVVEMVVQVPRPEFLTMAEYGTLAGFNQFRPPMLDIVADQVVPIQGIEAQYYRHKDGACSLLFQLDKQAIVNIITKRCSNAALMMKVAKGLNFPRLIQKLNS